MNGDRPNAGSASNSSTRQPIQENGHEHTDYVELSPSHSVTPLSRKGPASWARESISSKDMVIPLIVCTLSTAVIDAVVFKEYRVFATAQTGNTVILALSALGTGISNTLLSGVALASFFLAGIVFGQIGYRIGHHTRYWIIGSMGFQVILLVIASILISPIGPSSLRPVEKDSWAIILLVGTQSGAQMAMVINAGVPEIPTAILTSAYANFTSSPNLFHWHALRQEKRLAYILAFWTGCFIGAVIAKYSELWVGIVVALGCKFVVVLLFCFAKGETTR